MTDSQGACDGQHLADVVVLGTGPAGLVPGDLRLRSGIDRVLCVLLERASGERLRAPAGFLAAHPVRILERNGPDEGPSRRGQEHGVCDFRTEDGRFRPDYRRLGRGEPHTVHPGYQPGGRLRGRCPTAVGRIRFRAEAVAVHDADHPAPCVTDRAACPASGARRSPRTG
ncbi:hypothetical protein I3F60_30040 [Streptomyces sp. MUM 136J]|uniref:FAD-dependent monooxygenase n=1 Tax=Streptomyces sp. MUM 136J TaxID=2791992 RepID=UPI001F046FC9|nr:FAD-dependent monooxygenase [Streptomyces sp. MUM 136J]MCH0573424.1 hypothetical protein [Streptomyces sp. MUM 136J]